MMWKTKFQLNHAHEPRSNHSHSPIRSSFFSGLYCSRTAPSVSRVRADSPIGVRRSSHRSSTASFEVLLEEDEETAHSKSFDKDENNAILPITASTSFHRTNSKHRLVLPTIIESHDHEAGVDDTANDTYLDKTNRIVSTRNSSLLPFTKDYSLGPTNTNYNPKTSINSGKRGRIFKKNQSVEITGFTVEKRINELLQRRNACQEKIDQTEILPSTKFKEINAIFEEKVSSKTMLKTIKPKKLLKAKRNIQLQKTISFPSSRFWESIKKFALFHEQAAHLQYQNEQIIDNDQKLKPDQTDNFTEESSSSIHSIVYNHHDEEHNQKSSSKSILFNLVRCAFERWFLILIIILGILWFLFSHYSPWILVKKLINHSMSSVTDEKNSQSISPPNWSQRIFSMGTRIMLDYGRFVRHRLYSLLTRCLIWIAHLFFFIEKSQHDQTLTIVVTLTLEKLINRMANIFLSPGTIFNRNTFLSDSRS